MKDSYHSSAIQRALDILQLFKDRQKLSFTEMKELLGFNKSTLFRVLHILEQNGFLHRDKNGRYEVGIKMFILGNRFSRAYHITKAASPHLRELSARTGLTVHLGTLEGLEVVIIGKYEPPGNIKMVSRVGATVPAHCTGQGKVLIAYAPRAEVERIIDTHGLKQFTPNTITSSEELFAELSEIRRRGYAIDDSEHEKHIRCVAVPLFNDRGECEVAISVTGLRMDLKDDGTLEHYTRLLQEARDKIGAELGFKRAKSTG